MGYTVKIQDGQGNLKAFHCDRAPKHVQGSALASALIMHLTANYPAFMPFSTRDVTPKTIANAVDIDDATEATWP